MTKRTTFSVLLLLLTGGCLSAQTEKRWSLKDCIDYALENNISLQQARLSLQSAETDVKEAKAGLQPTLSASITQTAQYRPLQEEASNLVNGSVASSSSNKFTQSGSYGINANWTVWNGGRNRQNITDSKYSLEIADLNVQQTANSIQEQIAQLYIQILYSEEAERVNRELLENDKQLLERGKVLLAQGQLAKSDVAQLEAQVSSGEYDVVNASTQISSYKLQLKQLLELDNEDVINISDIEVTDEAVLVPVPVLAEVYQAALELRPEIKSGEISVEQSDLAVKTAKAAYMPTISLTAGLGDSHMTGTSQSYGSQMKNNFNGSLGVSFSIPIFDNRSTKSSVERAKINQLTTRLDLQDARKQLYSSIETYYQNSLNYQARYKSSVSNVASLETSYELRNEQFKLGATNIAELLSSRSDLLSAKQEMLQNKYTALLNLALLNFYRGESLSI